MINIFKTFEIFWREPLSILRNGFIRLSSIQTSVVDTKSSVTVDFVDKKPQITVVNNEKMYSIFKTVMYKKRMMEQESEVAKR